MTPNTQVDDDRIIEAAYQDLLTGYLASNHRKKVEMIERAYKFAKDAHKGIRRRSGEPYILHPIAVAKIANQEIGLGSTSICAALLHDVVEDTEYTVEDIEMNFGKKVAQLVEGLTKISGGIFGDKASAQAENFRKLLLTMSEDIRVVLLKMADRLHNMRTLSSMAANKQYKIAGETLYIYAPLAHRLGLFAIKTELEDLSFKYEHPGAYDRITKKIADSEARRSAVFANFSAPINEKLQKMGLKYEAKARMKSVYSIWRKMEVKHIPFEEVYDLYAMRIIFECDDPSLEKSICWQIYAAITDIYRLHPERTRDWISTPKTNGYQALHLTVMGPDGNWVEVQIRSRRMDEIAELGFAAHWKYKIGEVEEEKELNAWLSTIKDILENPEPNAIDFLDTLKLNLFSSEILVFTPKGELLTLPNNSSVLDVAFELHSEIGAHCIAGKVNHKLVPLSHKLQSGDQIEVLTSQSQRPKAEWMKFLATSKARTRLRALIRKEIAPLVEEGRKIYESFLAQHSLTDNNEVVTKILGTCKLENKESLFVALAKNEVELNQRIAKILQAGQQTSILSKIIRPIIRKKNSNSDPAHINTKEVYRLQASADGTTNYRLCDCCHPLPGDDVMGWINEKGDVELHQLSCSRASILKTSYGPRVIAVEWGDIQTTFLTEIRIEGIDRRGLLQEIIQIISKQMSIDIRRLNIEAVEEVFSSTLVVKVNDSRVVNDLCNKLKKVNGVKIATRVG